MSGDPAQEAELESLLLTPFGDAGYRAACEKAIRLAGEMDRPSLALEQLLSRFIATGPAADAEIASFLTLGALYERHRLFASAREVYDKVLAKSPGHPEASARWARLPPEPHGAAAEALPDLPDLPDLPEPGALQRSLEVARVNAPLAASSPFALGTVIAQRYRLVERLGEGGTALVFRAADLDLGEEVAIKVFKQLAQEGEAEDRFKREVKLSRQLAHPNVIRLHDVGYHAGFRYLSMELLVGSSLREHMESGLRLSDLLDYASQACAGLHAAHEHGIVHRDLKPENCFVTREGVLKVMDFGLAKVQSALGVTTTGVIAGTPAYMAPEQIRNFSGVAPAADLYALGVLMYEALTSRLPFQHADSMSVLMMHLSDTPAPPSEHNALVPPELEEVVLKLLEKDPARRFTSALELGARLSEIRLKLFGGPPAA